MIMTTECGGGKAAPASDPTTAEAKLTMAALDADLEIKRDASPPPPSISLKSVQERLSRFGSTVKFRTEAAGEAAVSAEDESCQPQDLSVKRRDQGSQTECDKDRGGGEKAAEGAAAAKVIIRRMSQKPFSSESEAPPAPASDLERMLRIWLVIFRRLAAAGAAERKSFTRLPKVD